MSADPSNTPADHLADLRLIDARLTKSLTRLDDAEFELDRKRMFLAEYIVLFERLSALNPAPAGIHQVLAVLRSTHASLGAEIKRLAGLADALRRARDDLRELAARLEWHPSSPTEVVAQPAELVAEPTVSQASTAAASPVITISTFKNGSLEASVGPKRIRLATRLAALFRALISHPPKTRDELRLILADRPGVPISTACLNNLRYRLKLRLLRAGISPDVIL